MHDIVHILSAVALESVLTPTTYVLLTKLCNDQKVDTEIKVEYSDMPNNRRAQINVQLEHFFICVGEKTWKIRIFIFFQFLDPESKKLNTFQDHFLRTNCRAFMP